jgi:hypothetical protein
MYADIQPEPPLSEGAWRFFAARPEVDMHQMFPMATSDGAARPFGLWFPA